MPAKSFLGEVSGAVRHFYATELRGEVSDANVRGYLRAATQIEDLWQQIDDRLAELMAQGVPPWEAYGRLRYAFAFSRAARAHQLFVRELLAADAAAHAATSGYLPRVTYDQANALCHQILPDLQQGIAALNEPDYVPEAALPLRLVPRIEAEGACPPAHLRGILGAAVEVREWAAGLIAQYETAVARGTPPVPEAITTHITHLQSRLAQADSQLRFATDLVGQVTAGEATPELHEQAEDHLWQALRAYFLLNQAVAFPELLTQPSTQPHAPRRSSASRSVARKTRASYADRAIRPADLWRFAAPSARSEICGTPFGTREMRELCTKMGGVLSARAQQYLDEVAAASDRGDVYIVAAMANCPFEPLYRTRRALRIASVSIPAKHEFHWDFHRGHIEQYDRFSRVAEWRECAE